MISRWILATLLLGCLRASGITQSATIHFDKPYYLAGEYVFYSFCNTEVLQDTLVANVLFGSKDRTISNIHIEVYRGCGHGYMRIPYETPTGQYSFEVLTFLKNSFENVTIIEHNLSVYNDEDIGVLENKLVENRKSKEQDLDSLGSRGVSNDGGISFRLNVNELGWEEGMKISVAVRDAEVYANKKGDFAKGIDEIADSAFVKGVPFRGERKLITTSTIKSNLLFSFNATEMHFDGADVQNDGHFNMVFTPFYGEQEICFLDFLNNDIKISNVPLAQLSRSHQKVEVDDGVLRHLRWNKESKEINRIFKSINTELNLDTSYRVKDRLEPDFIVDVQDYAIRGTTRDLFKEIMTGLKFRRSGRKSEYRARMLFKYNGITRFYTRDPLFLINNRATRDGALISKIPLQQIRYFEIYSDYLKIESLSPMAHGGLVYIDMMDTNYALPEDKSTPLFPVRGLQEPAIYPIRADTTDVVPEIGTLMYWQPDQDVEGEDIHFTFVPNAVSTLFTVEVMLHGSTTESITRRYYLRVQ